MLKLKLFLLGGILSILTIGSFSSAFTLNCTCDVIGGSCEGTCSSSFSLNACREYILDDLQTNAPISEFVNLGIYGGFGGFDWINYGNDFGVPVFGTYNFSPSPQLFNVDDFHITFDDDVPEDGTTYYVNYVLSEGGIDNSVEGCEDYVDDGTDEPDVPVIPDNPDNPGDSTSLIGQLSPIILGLFDVVYQIIPYVIYIGIGILIAVLGFFAIRWLVIWISDKINSNFNSKRD